MNKPWIKTMTDRSVKRRRERLTRRISSGYFSRDNDLRMARNSLYSAELKKKPTKAELIVGDFLWENKIHFKFQKGFLTPFHRIVDFYLATRNLIIEVDGGYHKNIKEKDIIKDEQWLKKRNITTIRLTNEEVFNGEFKNKVRFILE